MKSILKPFLFLLVTGHLCYSCNRTAVDDQPITVSLQPMVPADAVSMRWSPKGEKLELKGSGPEWSAELNIGPEESASVKLLLAASSDNPYPDRLKGDWNRNGSLDDDHKKLYSNSRSCANHAWPGNTAYRISAIDPTNTAQTIL
jgi:hypothetical protein